METIEICSFLLVVRLSFDLFYFCFLLHLQQFISFLVFNFEFFFLCYVHFRGFKYEEFSPSQHLKCFVLSMWLLQFHHLFCKTNENGTTHPTLPLYIHRKNELFLCILNSPAASWSSHTKEQRKKWTPYIHKKKTNGVSTQNYERKKKWTKN